MSRRSSTSEPTSSENKLERDHLAVINLYTDLLAGDVYLEIGCVPLYREALMKRHDLAFVHRLNFKILGESA